MAVQRAFKLIYWIGRDYSIRKFIPLANNPLWKGEFSDVKIKFYLVQLKLEASCSSVLLHLKEWISVTAVYTIYNSKILSLSLYHPSIGQIWLKNYWKGGEIANCPSYETVPLSVSWIFGWKNILNGNSRMAVL